MKKVIAIVGAGLLLAAAQASFAANSFNMKVHNTTKDTVYLIVHKKNLNGPEFVGRPIYANETQTFTYNQTVPAANELDFSASDDKHGLVTAHRIFKVIKSNTPVYDIKATGDLKSSDYTHGTGEFGDFDITLQ